jgi:hypothetical protein
MVEIEVNDIESTQAGPWLRGLLRRFPGLPSFKIRPTAGREFVFQTLFPGHWRREIERLAVYPAAQS